MFLKKLLREQFSLFFKHLRGTIFNKVIYFYSLLNYFQNLNLLNPDIIFLDPYSKFCCLKSFYGSGWAINYK